MCFPEERRKKKEERRKKKEERRKKKEERRKKKEERRSLLFHLYTTWSDSLKAKTKGFR
ncbi:hypothetical protein L4C37_03060 [Vibrio kagoshimensis]|uniref:hypothetical protein n=1 Tax=Vibrio kagoshimensis TaxID=2910244 RepID=UPI003D1A6351